MRGAVLHDAFVPQNYGAPPVPAVSLGAGATWLDAYTAVTTEAGRYVQGGGCTTVGVPGLGRGLVVLTACSHRGVVNSVGQAHEATGVQTLHAVIGGFHLVAPPRSPKTTCVGPCSS
jgi:hypothetical protein